MILTDRDVPASAITGAWHLHALPVVFVIAALARVRPGICPHPAAAAEAAPWTRAALFAAGLAVMAVPLMSPLNAAGEHYLVSAHMLEHVLLADAGPALLVLAVRGPVARSLLPRPPPAVLLRPRVTLAAWVAVIGVWHVPGPV